QGTELHGVDLDEVARLGWVQLLGLADRIRAGMASVRAETFPWRFDEPAPPLEVRQDAPHGGDRPDDAFLGQEALELGLAPAGIAFPEALDGSDVFRLPGGLAAAVGAGGAAFETGRVPGIE